MCVCVVVVVVVGGGSTVNDSDIGLIVYCVHCLIPHLPPPHPHLSVSRSLPLSLSGSNKR